MYIISYEHILNIPIGVYRLVNYTIYLVLTQSFSRKFSIYLCRRKNGSIINVGVTPLRCHFQHYFFAKK